jgi:hypothetical protein
LSRNNVSEWNDMSTVLHSSGTFVSGKMTISRKNRDVIDAFLNCCTTSFYWKGYYYHSQMSLSDCYWLSTWSYRNPYARMLLKFTMGSVTCVSTLLFLIDPFTITAVLHSSGTFVSDNNTLSSKMTSYNNLKMHLWRHDFSVKSVQTKDYEIGKADKE